MINPFLYLNVVLKDKVLYFLYTLKVVQGLETTLMSLHALFDTWEKISILILIQNMYTQQNVEFPLFMIISIIICLPLMFLWGLKYKYLAYYYWHRWSLIWEYYWRSLFMSNFISWKSTVHIINSVVLWRFLKQNIWKINFCANPSFHWKMNWRIKFFFPLKNELENKILLSIEKWIEEFNTFIHLIVG